MPFGAIRLSLDPDQSCARQERDLVAFAARAGYDVVSIFKETGSGVKLAGRAEEG